MSASVSAISVPVLATIIAGVVIHFTDPKNFPDIGDGLWWSVQTVTTVGYGDLVPTSTTGRFVGAVVMVVGIGFLTVITASITSAFIEAARRRLEERGGGADALEAKAQAQREKIEQETLGALRELATRVAEIERRLP